jgi:hypothetical protein
MKTADSIEEQTERKAARGESDKHDAHKSVTVRVRSREETRAAQNAAIAPYRWQPGKSANPGGRPKHDLAAEIARAVFEKNAEALYKAYTKAALRGNAYCFKELSDRAYGKLKERVEHEVTRYQAANEQEIHERIAELERQLGIEHETPALPPAPDSKPN